MTNGEINREEVQQALSHVLWIGGATDSGKTTVARIITYTPFKIAFRWSSKICWLYRDSQC